MTLQPITGILMLVASLSALVVMGGWHLTTRGAWRRWVAGVALMGLLATLAAITGLAAASSFFPEFPGRAVVYIVLYCVFIASIWSIGWAIYRAQRDRN